MTPEDEAALVDRITKLEDAFGVLLQQEALAEDNELEQLHADMLARRAQKKGNSR